MNKRHCLLEEARGRYLTPRAFSQKTVDIEKFNDAQHKFNAWIIDRIKYETTLCIVTRGKLEKLLLKDGEVGWITQKMKRF